nr:LuxR C-terminal-related transcriptional regulator [Hoeflea prorocentri]
MFEAWEAEPEPVDAAVRRENLSIEVHGTLAWATFQEIVDTGPNPLAVPSHSLNFRLLENTDGQWRILFHGCWAEPLRNSEAPAIEVLPDARVVWLNSAAQTRLKTFGGLTISNGKLRASRPSLNAGLHNAISGAHNLTGFGKFNQAARNAGGDVKFPVVLGEQDDGALLLCWVKVADGRVYILFDHDRDLSRNIDIAQTIYGLSDAQTETVRHIAHGMDLSDTAAALGITKNTARTHLRRVYDKVGVSSQIELLRLLISFDS